MKENSALLDEALHRALHGMAGAKERWAKRLKGPVNDAELAEAVSYEFGSYGGFCGMGMAYHYRGGKNPEFSLGFTGDRLQIKGKTLLSAVRRVLCLNYCLDYRQLELPMEASAP